MQISSLISVLLLSFSLTSGRWVENKSSLDEFKTFDYSSLRNINENFNITLRIKEEDISTSIDNTRELPSFEAETVTRDNGTLNGINKSKIIPKILRGSLKFNFIPIVSPSQFSREFKTQDEVRKGIISRKLRDSVVDKQEEMENSVTILPIIASASVAFLIGMMLFICLCYKCSQRSSVHKAKTNREMHTNIILVEGPAKQALSKNISTEPPVPIVAVEECENRSIDDTTLGAFTAGHIVSSIPAKKVDLSNQTFVSGLDMTGVATVLENKQENLKRIRRPPLEKIALSSQTLVSGLETTDSGLREMKNRSRPKPQKEYSITSFSTITDDDTDNSNPIILKWDEIGFGLHVDYEGSLIAPSIASSNKERQKENFDYLKDKPQPTVNSFNPSIEQDFSPSQELTSVDEYYEGIQDPALNGRNINKAPQKRKQSTTNNLSDKYLYDSTVDESQIRHFNTERDFTPPPPPPPSPPPQKYPPYTIEYCYSSSNDRNDTNSLKSSLSSMEQIYQLQQQHETHLPPPSSEKEKQNCHTNPSTQQEINHDESVVFLYSSKRKKILESSFPAESPLSSETEVKLQNERAQIRTSLNDSTVKEGQIDNAINTIQVSPHEVDGIQSQNKRTCLTYVERSESLNSAVTQATPRTSHCKKVNKITDEAHVGVIGSKIESHDINYGAVYHNDVCTPRIQNSRILNIRYSRSHDYNMKHPSDLSVPYLKVQEGDDPNYDDPEESQVSHNHEFTSEGINGAVQNESTLSKNTDTPSNTMIQKRINVVAPAGKIGIVLANKSDNKGTIVSKVKSSSSLHGKIFKGDQIVQIDGVDVSNFTILEIGALMEKKSDMSRTLGVVTSQNIF